MINVSLPTDIQPSISTWIFRSCWLASHCVRYLGNFDTNANRGLRCGKLWRIWTESFQWASSKLRCKQVWLVALPNRSQNCGLICLSEKGFRDLSEIWNSGSEGRRCGGGRVGLPAYASVFSASPASRFQGPQSRQQALWEATPQNNLGFHHPPQPPISGCPHLTSVWNILTVQSEWQGLIPRSQTFGQWEMISLPSLDRWASLTISFLFDLAGYGPLSTQGYHLQTLGQLMLLPPLPHSSYTQDLLSNKEVACELGLQKTLISENNEPMYCAHEQRNNVKFGTQSCSCGVTVSGNRVPLGTCFHPPVYRKGYSSLQKWPS